MDLGEAGCGQCTQCAYHQGAIDAIERATRVGMVSCRALLMDNNITTWTACKQRGNHYMAVSVRYIEGNGTIHIRYLTHEWDWALFRGRRVFVKGNGRRIHGGEDANKVLVLEGSDISECSTDEEYGLDDVAAESESEGSTTEPDSEPESETSSTEPDSEPETEGSTTEPDSETESSSTEPDSETRSEGSATDPLQRLNTYLQLLHTQTRSDIMALAMAGNTD